MRAVRIKQKKRLMTILDGKALAQRIKNQLKEEVL
jgi:hypothetical protein